MRVGIVTSAASVGRLAVSATAANWNRAGPGAPACARKRTSALPPDLRWRRLGPSSTCAFAARQSTSSSASSPVSLCTTAAASKVSPTLRKRGREGRTSTGRRTTIRDSPAPKDRASSAATAITRNSVRLSGSLKRTSALPLASVRTSTLK